MINHGGGYRVDYPRLFFSYLSCYLLGAQGLSIITLVAYFWDRINHEVENSSISNYRSPFYMANIIFRTINNTRANLGTDKASSRNIWLQESDFFYAVGKTCSQQKSGFRNWVCGQ